MSTDIRQNQVSAARVMVVGCGALGNEVLKNLVLMGVTHIVVVDFDIVEMGNLTRSVLFTKSDAERKRLKVEVVAERLQQMNAAVEVTAICGDIAYDVGLGLVRQMDVVIGCVDSRWARFCINRLCMRAGIPWVDGGTEGSGETDAMLGHHPEAGTGWFGPHDLHHRLHYRSHRGAGGAEDNNKRSQESGVRSQEKTEVRSQETGRRGNDVAVWKDAVLRRGAYDVPHRGLSGLR